MRYEFHPEALDEYEAAARWYGEREPGLGKRFVEAVEDAIERILEAPNRWRLVDEDVRVVSPVFSHMEFCILLSLILF